MKRLSLLIAIAVGLALPGSAWAIGQCGLPSQKPLWIDHASVALGKTFGRPGVIIAASSGDFPAQMRAAGAKTVYWDMNLKARVGLPSAPNDPATIVDRANRLFDYAAKQSGCDKPLIALNELFGAHLETPWSPTNTQYRANVLTFLRTLAERGARPFLLLSTSPFTAGEAGDWWREAARYADLVPEVYFAAPGIHRRGPIVGNRTLRTTMRSRIQALRSAGVPAARIGIVLGFQTGRGSGGREGLQPRSAWFEYIKWNVLAARQVARELGISTIWSWGWPSYNGSDDPDKPGAACVYLWVRNPSFCNGPAAAGPGFNKSLTEGQLILPRGRQCTIGRRAIPATSIATLARMTGDRELAYSALLARIAESEHVSVSAARVIAAERTVIATRFRGSGAAYRAALRRARATVSMARGILADELRRATIEARLAARRPSAAEISAFYEGYPDLLVRAVEAKPAPWWLGHKRRGLAFASLAPEQVFRLRPGARAKVRAVDGAYTVRAVGDAQRLGSLTLAQARAGIAAALSTFARRAAFDDWSVERQTATLTRAVCRRDDLPAPASVRLTSYLPFLSLSGV